MEGPLPWCWEDCLSGQRHVYRPQEARIWGKEHVKPSISPQLVKAMQAPGCTAITTSLQGETGRLRPRAASLA